MAVKPAGTTLELRVYQALLKLGWRQQDIEIQTPILGGRSKRGGQVLDFVVYRPSPLPIEANGDYWHRDEEREYLATVEAFAAYGVYPVIIWGSEATTPDETYQVVLNRVGRP